MEGRYLNMLMFRLFFSIILSNWVDSMAQQQVAMGKTHGSALDVRGRVTTSHKIMSREYARPKNCMIQRVSGIVFVVTTIETGLMLGHQTSIGVSASAKTPGLQWIPSRSLFLLRCKSHDSFVLKVEQQFIGRSQV